MVVPRRVPQVLDVLFCEYLTILVKRKITEKSFIDFGILPIIFDDNKCCKLHT